MIKKIKATLPLSYSEVIQSINFFLFLTLVFALPFSDSYLPLLLSLWIGTWVLEGNFTNRFLRPKYLSLWLALLFYFLLVFVNAFRVEDIGRGFFYVQESLSLIFFPLMFLGANNKIKKNPELVLKIFILGNFAASLLCLGNALNESLQMINGTLVFSYKEYPDLPGGFLENIQTRHNYFSYKLLSFFKHPSYLSMHFLFAGIATFSLLRNKKIHNKYTRIFFIFLLFFFTGMIYLIHSRGGMLAYVVAVLTIVLVEILEKKQKILLLFSVLLVLFSAYTLFSDSQYAYTTDRVKNFMDKEQRKTSIQAGDRISIWYAGIDIIKDHTMWGIAPGNIHEAIVDKFHDYDSPLTKEEIGYDNLHNQYIDAWASMGIFGIISLVFILGNMFFIALKKRKYLLFFLLNIFCVNLLFESMLNRIAGVVFFMLFTSFFLWGEKIENEEKY